LREAAGASDLVQVRILLVPFIVWYIRRKRGAGAQQGGVHARDVSAGHLVFVYRGGQRRFTLRIPRVHVGPGGEKSLVLPVGIGARRQGATHRVRVASLKSIVERFVYFRRHLVVRRDTPRGHGPV
jgi:hypothetical protein